MDTLPHVFQQVLRSQPHVPPPLINDDSFYVVNLRTRTVIKEIGASNPMAQQARQQGIAVLPGQALVRGMEARMLGVLA